MQEGRAASAVVKEMFPDAEVQVVRLNSYPIKVSIYQITDGVKSLVWSGDQRGLFGKYNHRAIPEIKQKLSALK
eukprot:m.62771 g.62771  ORF g.62771 m.62771 type:complete len:74 (-) comp15814_c0_seq1:680-901(-)